MATSKIVLCPACHSNKLNLFVTQTESNCRECFEDKDFKEHAHDGNTKNKSYVCKQCNNKWHVVVPYTCWCGWIQGKDNTGYQGVRTRVEKIKSED